MYRVIELKKILFSKEKNLNGEKKNVMFVIEWLTICCQEVADTGQVDANWKQIVGQGQKVTGSVIGTWASSTCTNAVEFRSCVTFTTKIWPNEFEIEWAENSKRTETRARAGYRKTGGTGNRWTTDVHAWAAAQFALGLLVIIIIIIIPVDHVALCLC